MFLCRTRLRNSDYVVVLEAQILRLLSHSSSAVFVPLSPMAWELAVNSESKKI
jgi:hypothetical protein